MGEDRAWYCRKSASTLSVATKHAVRPREEFYHLVSGAQRAQRARRARRPKTAFYWWCCVHEHVASTGISRTVMSRRRTWPGWLTTGTLLICRSLEQRKFLITRSVDLVWMSEINVEVLIRTQRIGFFSIYIMVLALVSLFFSSYGHGSVSLSLFFSFFFIFFIIFNSHGCGYFLSWNLRSFITR